MERMVDELFLASSVPGFNYRRNQLTTIKVVREIDPTVGLCYKLPLSGDYQPFSWNGRLASSVLCCLVYTPRTRVLDAPVSTSRDTWKPFRNTQTLFIEERRTSGRDMTRSVWERLNKRGKVLRRDQKAVYFSQTEWLLPEALPPYVTSFSRG